MKTYIIKHKNSHYQYIIKSDGTKEQTFKFVCKKFGWREKNCIIREINIFDYIVNFFWRVIRKIKGV